MALPNPCGSGWERCPAFGCFADYTCETLCGPALSIVSDALAQSGLRPGVDFRLVAVELDPKDTAADAANMKQVGRRRQRDCRGGVLPAR